MATKKIRIGILGGGAMSSEHASVCREIEGVEVAGVFSRIRERAEATAKLCGAKPVTDAFALLDDPTIDAIDVCLPSANHPEFVIAALERGKHVFCETPFALRLPDAEAMVAAARKFKRILQVGLLMRSIAQYEHVRLAVQSGDYGKLLSVTTYRLGSYLQPGAFDHKEHYSDPSTELMTFDFDFIRWLLGTPARLSATAVSTEVGTPGEISAVLDYGGVHSATVLASGIMPKSFPFSAGFRALFEKGAFELETVFLAGPPTSSFRFFGQDGPPQAVVTPDDNPYEKELRYFVDCVAGEANPELLDPQHAIEALRLSIATQESIRKGQAIALNTIR
jgi:predicted dehydrogenase